METGKFSLFLYVLVYFTLSQISFKLGNICKATTCRVYMTLFLQIQVFLGIQLRQYNW